MSDIIKLLPDSVANQIAAGEVVKRPASVIKELVENAADAGATRIDVFIKDGGRTLIQVVDNGRGMSPTDARMAFERHATSKITTAADLFSLHTMGFRGEALPSICAIAQVELRTRPAQETMGTRLLISGSRVESQQPDMCDAGTNIMVRNLFFNVPARRKFMRSDSVETGYIMREFERLALVNNNIHMSIDTGSRHIDLRPANFKQRIADIWRNNLNTQLVAVDVETSMVKIHGFISRPEFARRRNPLQYLIANGRNMYHPRFHKAILTAFENLIAKDTQPCYFIKIEVDPDTIDVIIHPTKHEIKFENENEIWSILHSAVRASLGKNAAVPAIDFNSDVLPVDTTSNPETPTAPRLDIDNGYNPFRQNASPKPPTDWEKLYADFMGGGKTAASAPGAENAAPAKASPALEPNPAQLFEAGKEAVRPQVEIEQTAPEAPQLPEMGEEPQMSQLCLQYACKYIITTSREGLLVIDQYRAHLRILFDRYMHRMRAGEATSQGVMFPQPVTLDERQMAVLAGIMPQLRQLGFTLEEDEERSDRMRIVTVPTMLHNSDPVDVVLGIIDSVNDKSVGEGIDGVGAEAMQRRMALVMARSNAIQGGRRLTPDEMEHIIGELFSLPEPARTPEGNPVYILFDPHRLESLFSK